MDRRLQPAAQWTSSRSSTTLKSTKLNDSSSVLLERYIQTGDTEQSQRDLEVLVSEHAKPVVNRILSAKFQFDPKSQFDLEDLSSEALTQLILQLRKIKEDPSPTSRINKFDDYVASITFNTWNKYLRNAHPLRARMRSRLRYVLTHHPELDLWQLQTNWFCGHKRWKQISPTIDLESLRAIRMIQDPDLSRQVIHVFTQLRAAVSFPLLIDYFCHLQGVEQPGSPVSALEELKDSSESIDVIIEKKEELRDVWEEIKNLPLNQRRSLLLSLRDEHGGGMLLMFSVAGIAFLRDFAKVLEFDVEEFARLWNSLPLEDLKIAKRIGATRQQVINMRKCARERLTRRMIQSKGNMGRNLSS